MNRSLFLFVFAFLAAACELMAQENVVTEPRRDPVASIRVWIFDADQDVRFEALPARGATGPMVLSTAEKGVAALRVPYTEVPEGRLALSLLAGDRVLASGDVEMASGRHYTVVVWPGEDKWQLKVFSDSTAPDSRERRLRVLNFSGGRSLELAIDGKMVQGPAPSSLAEMKVPAEITDILTRVMAKDGGAPAESTLEVDFTIAPSAYVVVQPDYRGRLRPRVYNGGEITEPAGEGESVPADRPGPSGA